VRINVGRTTLADILRDAGLEPAPEREKKRTWKEFLRSHWHSLYACDFFSVEAFGGLGTVRYLVLFVMEVRTRAVEIAGIGIDPVGSKYSADEISAHSFSFRRRWTTGPPGYHRIMAPVIDAWFVLVVSIAGWGWLPTTMARSFAVSASVDF
jgi:hypothetical protein